MGESKYYNSCRLSDNMKLPVVVRFSGWEICDPDHIYGPVKRDHYIMHYVTRGKGVFKTGKNTYEISSGDGFLIYPYEITYYKADHDHPWEYYWIAWGGEFSQQLISNIKFTQDNSVVHNDNINEMIDIFQEIFKLYENEYNHYDLLGGFYSLMSNFIVTANDNNQIINKAITFIHNHYRNIKSIEEIADHIFISRSCLYRVFMEALEKSPKQFLTDFRIQKAQELLESSTLSIDKISGNCGFKSTSHFSNIFKEKIGLSPTQYRSLYKSDLGLK